MTKSFRIIFPLLFVAVVGVVAWKTARQAEPVYEGRLLTSWLEGHVASSAANPPYNSPGWLKADEALRRIGTNAVPTLLRMIRAKSPAKPMLDLLDLARKQSVIPIRYRHAFLLNNEAEFAFRTLGTNAAGAVSDLIEIYEGNVSPYSQMSAALALGDIGPAAKAAIPILLKNFTHTNDDVRFYAVSAIYHIGGDADVVVPALRSVLKDTRIHVRWNAIVALSNFGRRASSAIPDLLQALEDPGKVGNDTTKEQVETAIWRIAPEKIGKPFIVEESTPLVANGITTERVDVIFKGERGTLIRSGVPVPCLGQHWDSEPRTPLDLYRVKNQTNANDHFLGRFEVMGIPPPPGNANISVLCIVVDQKIILCARDNTFNRFLEIRRVENEITK